MALREEKMLGILFRCASMHAQVCGTQQEDCVIISQAPAATNEQEAKIAHRSVVVVINAASVEFLETAELQEANLHARGWEELHRGECARRDACACLSTAVHDE